MHDRGSMGMTTEDGKEELKSYEQKLFKVGYGPNLRGIISEDSLNKYDYLEGCIEEYGTRTLYYVEQETETHSLETEE